MSAELVNIGFNSYVCVNRIIAVVSTDSAPMRRVRDDARGAGRLLDATQGRKTRSMIIMDSNHVILSSLQAETVNQRIRQDTSHGQG
jgi:regulator of extracellular matrix RemA (YlzA/DUF370 family)